MYLHKNLAPFKLRIRPIDQNEQSTVNWAQRNTSNASNR